MSGFAARRPIEAYRPEFGGKKMERGSSPSERFFMETYRALSETLSPPPQCEDFTHVSPAEAKQDALRAKNVASGFQKAIGGDAAKAMETFLEVEIDRSDWFGATTFRTTEYDDFLNGVDLVLEWEPEEGEEEPVRLAIDITTARTSSTLLKKEQKTSHDATVKYFHSDVEGEDCKIQAPLIVLGIDPLFVSLFAERAVEVAQTKTITQPDGRRVPERVLPKNAFAEHPVQLLLLEQADAQLSRLIAAMDSEDVWDANKMSEEVLHALAAYDKLSPREKTPERLADIFCSISFEEAAVALRPAQASRWKNLVSARFRILEKLDMCYKKIKNTPAYRRSVEDWQRAAAG